uniref:(northern house mosquito) hypothetical protein n=1 Tax=Culex pipiens TaxID=7175 RepID=A0A8D8CTK0_CULPI
MTTWWKFRSHLHRQTRKRKRAPQRSRRPPTAMPTVARPPQRRKSRPMLKSSHHVCLHALTKFSLCNTSVLIFKFPTYLYYIDVAAGALLGRQNGTNTQFKINIKVLSSKVQLKLHN